MNTTHSLILASILTLSTTTVHSQSIEVGRYSFDPSQGTALPVPSAISDPDVTMSGLSLNLFWDSIVDTSSGDPANCLRLHRTNYSTELDAFNANRFVAFTATPGTPVSFAQLTFDYARGTYGVHSYAVYASTGNFAYATHRVASGSLPSTGNNTAFSASPVTINLSNAAELQNVSAPITFRVYVWGSGWGSEYSRFDNFSLSIQPLTYELGPDADAFTRNGTHAGTNFGTNSTLEVALPWTVADERQSFLKFPLAVGDFGVGAARLKLTPLSKAQYADANATYKVLLVSDDTWTETGITFANKPKGYTELAQFTGAALTINSTLTLQLPAAAIQRAKAWHGSVSVALVHPVSNQGNKKEISFASDEHSEPAKRPTLEVDTAPAPAQALYPCDMDPSKLPPNGWQDVQWQNPGNWTTINVTGHGLPANSPAIDASQKVRDILANHPTGNLKLLFPSGTFYFKTDLAIARDNVIVEGAGRDFTRFEIAIPSGTSGGIRFAGSGYRRSDGTLEPAIPITAPATLGANAVTVSAGNASLFPAGSHAIVYSVRPINATENGTGSWAYDADWPDGLISFWGQIVQVTSSNSTSGVIGLSDKLGLDCSTSPRIRKLNVISNVGISGVFITRTINNTSTLNPSANIGMTAVSNGYVSDIESDLCANQHINVARCRDVVVTRNKLRRSYSYGSGGVGYGVQLVEHTTRAKVTDNKLWELRHHIILQRGPNHCVVSYNSVEPPYKNGTTTDNGTTYTAGGDTICFHGFFPHNNLIEGNMFYDSYVDFSDHGTGKRTGAGPRNTWFRNRGQGWIGTNVWAGDTNFTQNQLVMGNIGNIYLNDISLHYSGANIPPGLGTPSWGNLPVNAILPPSLYLLTKPAFLAGRPWPLFGPDLNSWGNSLKLPAADLPR
jgi:hypothetical protein